MASRSTLVSYMEKILVLALQIGLAVASFFFVQHTLNDFLEKKTYYQVKTLPITDLDIPTVTVCFDQESYHFNENDTFLWFSNDSNWLPIIMGENSMTNDDGLRIRLFLKPLSVASFSSRFRKCFKISPMEEGSNFSYLSGFIGSFSTFFSNASSAPNQMRLYVTSEQNSYGVVVEKWYDGHVEPYNLEKGRFHHILINKIDEYRHLEHHCAYQSYYHCLSSRLTKIQNCPNKCKPLTLPTTEKFMDMEWCNPENKCHNANAFNDLHNDKNVCKGSANKSCVVQEFSTEDYISAEDTRDEEFYFSLYMDSPNSLRQGLRMFEPFKTVHTEHYILDWMELIGTIGGTLGLMIGFSFMGCVSFMSKGFGVVKSVFKRKSKQRRNRVKKKRAGCRNVVFSLLAS